MLQMCRGYSWFHLCQALGGAQELLVNQVLPQAYSGIPAGQLDHL